MPDTASARAPGRVNLIGEHTDYHEGFVLPTVLPQHTAAHVDRRTDRRVRARSVAVGGSWEEYDVGSEQRGRGWLDYVQGVTVVLAQHGITAPGFSLSIESSVPVGAGVSSSAALEISVLRALRRLLEFEADDLALAKMAHAVETEFVGAPVGMMDPLAISLGRAGDALFIDTRTLLVEPIAIPPSIELVVIDSAVPHAHASGMYSTRRRESFAAAAQLGVRYLRDVDGTALERLAALPEPLRRRARHVVTENQRVLGSVEALRSSDPECLGALFAASHASMRDDFEVSTPDVDALVEIASSNADVYGARLTGGGFGGAVVLLARRGRGRAVAADICEQYRRNTNREGVVLVPSETA